MAAPKGTRFLSERQYIRATAIGLDVDGEGGPLDLVAGASTKIWDKTLDQRRPVLVRIQNISASPVNWSENLGKCNANQRNGILQADSAGGAAPAGDGGGIEFQRHIPKDIYVHCAGAVTILVTRRYCDEG
jgi:hypothetical protein